MGDGCDCTVNAVVLRGLSERRELDAHMGNSLGHIFQDLCVVPMVLMVPILGQPTPEALSEIGQALGLASLMVIGVVLVRLLLPRSQVGGCTTSNKYFCRCRSHLYWDHWLSSLAGLSVALGAFLGGMVVADTEYVTGPWEMFCRCVIFLLAFVR